MKPYGAKEPYVRFIECYCILCQTGITGPSGDAKETKKRTLRVGKTKERRRGKDDIKRQLEE